MRISGKNPPGGTWQFRSLWLKVWDDILPHLFSFLHDLESDLKKYICIHCPWDYNAGPARSHARAAVSYDFQSTEKGGNNIGVPESTPLNRCLVTCSSLKRTGRRKQNGKKRLINYGTRDTANYPPKTQAAMFVPVAAMPYLHIGFSLNPV